MPVRTHSCHHTLQGSQIQAAELSAGDSFKGFLILTLMLTLCLPATHPTTTAELSGSHALVTEQAGTSLNSLNLNLLF